MTFITHEPTGNQWHTCRIDLRWSDFDRYQHVNNAKYLEFTQDARTFFLRELLTEIEMPVPTLFARHTTIDYPRPVQPGESQVAVSSFITKIGTKSFTTRQQIQDGSGQLTCSVDTVMVGIDTLTGKSREWSEEDLQHLRRFHIPVEGATDGPALTGRPEAKK